MLESAIQLPINENIGIVVKEDKRTIEEKIFGTHTEELIIGLCGPIGTDIKFISEEIKEQLENNYRYECKTIKLSELIIRHKSINTIGLSPFDKKQKLIDAGNELRKEYGSSILAELAISEIAVSRELRKKGEDDFKQGRVCYIIDSFKNIDELNLFRLIYRDIFYFFGVSSSIERRIFNLKDQGLKDSEIYTLFDRDSGEEMKFGQKVTDTFVEADFFLRINNNSLVELQPKIKRYLNLIFSSEIITPSHDETSMYLAYAAAGNSACLSRQVGASITDKDGEIISIGWNDVPKANGGVYQTSSSINTDKRCLNLEGGVCFNDKEKEMMSDILVDSIIASNLIDEKNKEQLKVIIQKSRIKELIEFSRAVHAEMLAIITGSQNSGHKIIGGKLYCTTYPCHNCARHIIAAGIKEVYYIEPYRKSLAIKLHNDAITEDEAQTEKVRILFFDGVSPKRYLELFKMKGNRKVGGKKIKVSLKDVNPKNTLSLQAIPILETKVTEDLALKKIISIE